MDKVRRPFLDCAHQIENGAHRRTHEHLIYSFHRPA
jgi:hypothetical protein